MQDDLDRVVSVLSLCPDCAECPAVTIHADGTVTIGEPPELVTLTKGQWNVLVRAVREGRLTEAG